MWLPAPGRVTWQLAPCDSAVSHEIDATDLQPGDALNINTNVHQHGMLFMSWVNGTSKLKMWQEGAGGGASHDDESGTPGACALGAGSLGEQDGRALSLLGASLLLVAARRRKRA